MSQPQATDRQLYMPKESGGKEGRDEGVEVEKENGERGCTHGSSVSSVLWGII